MEAAAESISLGRNVAQATRPESFERITVNNMLLSKSPDRCFQRALRDL